MYGGGTHTEAAGRAGGLVTFVCGELANRAGWNQNRPDLMPGILEHLTAVVDEVAEPFGGARSRDLQDEGGFVVAFARPAEAAEFAGDVMAKLGGDDPWPGGVAATVRMALHTGPTGGAGDADARTVQRSVELLTLAHGGQVLVSSATADLVVDHLGSERFLRELGVHVLRDLSPPERVSQLCGPGLVLAFPPLRSIDRLPNNLPAQVTAFFGRDTEMAQVANLVAEQRIVTLVGAGGCGKTRLAIHVAARLVDQYPDGIWLVDLARLSEPALVPAAVAASLGLVEPPGCDITAALAEHLGHSETLILLDNCEHLLDASAGVAGALVRSNPGVRVLATSREPLGAEGEVTFRVSPLGLPSNPADTSCASVALFVDRARLARPTLRLTPGVLAAVTSICTRLDGIPLAIELAAARCRALTPTQIGAQLDRSFSLLCGSRRSGLGRQRTLEASVDWSYALLGEDERRVLRRLSVFAGGFTLDAAEAVCETGLTEGWEIIDVVASLVERSLVQTEDDEDTGESRFRILETIRQYAGQKLTEAGEAADVRQRHAFYFADLAEEAFRGIVGVDVHACQRLLDTELDNLRAADDWAADTGQPDLALRFAGRDFWFRRHPDEGRRRVERALDLGGSDRARRATGLITAADLHWCLGNFEESARSAEEALRIARDLGDAALTGEALNGLGWSAFSRCDDNARRWFAEGIEFLRTAGSEYWLADTLWGLGLLDCYAGTADGGRQSAAEALACARALGNPVQLVRALNVLTVVLMLDGDLDGAEALFDEARSLAAGNPDGFWWALQDSLVAWVSAARGRFDLAREQASDAHARACRTHLRHAVAWALLARVLAEFRGGTAPVSLDEAEEACRGEGMLWAVGQCQAIRAESLLTAGDPPGARRLALGAVAVTDSESHAGRGLARALLALARVQRAEDPMTAEDTGRRLLSALVDTGMQLDAVEALEFVAGITADSENAVLAARLFGAASASRQRLGYPIPPVEAPVVDADRQRACDQLGQADFETAFAEGEAMTVKAALAYGSRGWGARKRPSGGWASLTPMEIDVVRLVAEGLRNAEIAGKLFVSPETVKKHLSHVFAKLGVSTRAELAVLTTRHVDEVAMP